MSEKPFDFHLMPRVIFGENTCERAGELAWETGGRRAIVVTDEGVYKAGHTERVCESLRSAGLEVIVFAEARENPTEQDVEQCAAAARDTQIDILIALGGGSCIDTARGANFLLGGGGQMRDYKGSGTARGPMLPLIAIPTTGGTGSECQSYALISDALTHEKMACGDPMATARIAILDPTLSVTQPPEVTACTGIDAMAHALETAVTKPRNALSALFSREAFRLCVRGLPRVLKQTDDIQARGMMLRGAAWAGLAIENSMLGCAHALANPLTANHGVVHGRAVGLMLPTVIHFNAQLPEIAEIYAQLTQSAGLLYQSGHKDPVEVLIEHIRYLLDLANVPKSLHDAGSGEKNLPHLAAQASTQWTAGFNPRPVSETDLLHIYQQVAKARPDGVDHLKDRRKLR